jgi:hypothetical protein
MISIFVAILIICGVCSVLSVSVAMANLRKKMEPQGEI